MPKIGSCKLCDCEGELRHSHIIAETFYEGVYDPLHRFAPITSDIAEFTIAQRGYREYLLCANCEQKFGIWENTLKRDLVDIEREDSNFLTIIRKNNLIFVRNLNYNHFKMALLSILWRMSLSLNVFYSAYKLAIHEDIIKNILHNDVVVPENEFSIMVTKLFLQNNQPSKAILMFNQPGDFQGGHLYSFVLYGFLFDVVVSSKPLYNQYLPVFLRQNGDLIVKADYLRSLNFKRDTVNRLNDNDVRTFYNI